MSLEDPMTEIGKLNTKKATQRIDIPVKALSKTLIFLEPISVTYLTNA